MVHSLIFGLWLHMKSLEAIELEIPVAWEFLRTWRLQSLFCYEIASVSAWAPQRAVEYQSGSSALQPAFAVLLG